MQHDRRGSSRWSAPCALRTNALLLLAAACAGSSAGCLLVIGEPPPARDAGSDADTELGAPDSDVADGSSDAAPGEDSAAEDADTADGAQLDASTTPDAEAAVDAAADAGLEAETGVGPDTGAGPGDAGAPDGGDDTDCGAGTLTWYPDDDGDSYGRSAEPREACSRPAGKWSSVGGDCRDNDEKVHPNQTMFFDQPYSLGSGTDSFDYDCANGEQGDPTQAVMAGGCGPLGILLCTSDEKGYAPSDRVGVNVNPLCGSKRLNMCVWQTIALVCAAVEQSVETAYRCR
jgi:hypothetical protein